MKSFITILVLIAASFVQGSQHFNGSTVGGLDNCDVTSRPYHVCVERWNATTTVGCELAQMITTTATYGQLANWIETASTDNCENYDDDNGLHCEDFDNEPSNPNCNANIWGWWGI